MKKNYLKIIAVVLLCWMAVEANAQMNRRWTVGAKGGWNWTNIDRSNLGRIDETYSPLGNYDGSLQARYQLTDWLAVRADLGIGIHLPYDTGKSGYYNIPKFKDGLAFHLAIGYPF